MSVFDLTGRVAVITGGAGVLGRMHAEAIAEFGGTPILLDVRAEAAEDVAKQLTTRFGGRAVGVEADVTDEEALRAVLKRVLADFGRVDVLVNNAANNPTAEAVSGAPAAKTRIETLPLAVWNADIAIGLTAAFLCARVFGGAMADAGRGVILNIASDLAIIAPDQRLYRQQDLGPKEQPVKPVTYSVVKSGILGLTRYLATYWAEQGVRVNALSPGGVRAAQDETFVTRLSQLIPLGRMAAQEEYKGAVVFLVSDASSYMTGANLVVDGGRTAW